MKRINKPSPAQEQPNLVERIMAIEPSETQRISSSSNSPKKSKGRIDLRRRRRREEALARLGIEADTPLGLKITPKLAKIAGGIDAALAALDVYDSAEAQQFMEKWNTVSNLDRTRVSIEEVCVAAGLTTRRLLGVITEAIAEDADQVSKLMVAAARPLVEKKTIEMAQTDFGTADREWFHKRTQFIPPTKGLTIDASRNTNNNNLIVGEGRGLPPGNADKFLLDMQSTLRPELPAPAEPTIDVVANIPDLDYIEADDL